MPVPSQACDVQLDDVAAKPLPAGHKGLRPQVCRLGKQGVVAAGVPEDNRTFELATSGEVDEAGESFA